MHIRAALTRAAPLACAALIAAACRESTGPTQPLVAVTRSQDTSALRILMVGNSLTFFNDLPTRVAEIAANDSTLRAAHIESVTAGGANLQYHWATGVTSQLIASGHWDYVVLQEQSQAILASPESTEAVVRRFAALARTAGARTVLFLAWAALGSAHQDSTTHNYERIAEDTGTLIAPLGVAWQRALQADSTLPLYANNDLIHPSPMGTYLGACTMFATLYRHSPVGLAGTVALGDSVMVLSAATAALLQTTAWQATRPYLPIPLIFP